MDRGKLWLAGFVFGLFSSFIGALVFNYFFFRKLDKTGIEYIVMDKAAAVWGSLFGTAVTALIVLLIIEH